MFQKIHKITQQSDLAQNSQKVNFAFKFQSSHQFLYLLYIFSDSIHCSHSFLIIQDMSKLPQNAYRLPASKPSTLTISPSKFKCLAQVSNERIKPNERHATTSSLQKPSSYTKKQGNFFHTEMSQDSEFQFSEQIMVHTHNQTRNQRENTKLPWLSLLDWMAQKRSNLSLPKQVLFLGILILKLFLGSQNKTSLTLQNSRKISLVCLLLSSKLNSIGGNFLLSQQNKNNHQIKNLNKELFGYQQLVLDSLKFKVPNKLFFSEILIKILLTWNKISEQQKLTCVSFQFNCSTNQNKHTRGFLMFQMYIYLIDYVLIRKLVVMPTKDLHLLQQSFYFQLNLTNILFHLVQLMLRFYRQQGLLKKFQHSYGILVKEINSCPKLNWFYFRQSHSLCKLLRRLFNGSNQNFNLNGKTFQKIDKRQIVKTPQHFQKQCNNEFGEKEGTKVQKKEEPENSSQSPTIFDNQAQNKANSLQSNSNRKQLQQFRILFSIDSQRYIPLIAKKESNQVVQNISIRPMK